MIYKYKKELNNVLMTLFNFYIVYIILGMLLGFKDNFYSMKLVSIVKNMFMPFIMIIVIELLRYKIIKTFKNKKIIIFSIVLFILIEIIISYKSYYLSDAYMTMITIIKILNVISNNILLSFIDYKYDYKISIIYKLIIKLYIYIQIVVPNVDIWLLELILFLLSYFIYINIDKKDKYKFNIIKMIIFMEYILLYSGIFLIRCIPVYYSNIDTIIKGDAVIVYDKDIKLDDYVLYINNGLYTVSQVLDINYIDDDKYYLVKTDNKSDYALVSENNLRGVVLFNVPYMGYIPVLINDTKELIYEYIVNRVYQ